MKLAATKPQQNTKYVQNSWDVLYIFAVVGIYRWLSTRLQYLQCVSTGDTAVLHQAIDMNCLVMSLCAIFVLIGYYVRDVSRMRSSFWWDIFSCSVFKNGHFCFRGWRNLFIFSHVFLQLVICFTAFSISYLFQCFSLLYAIRHKHVWFIRQLCNFIPYVILKNCSLSDI